MIAFKNLEEILERTIKWENKLKDFFDVSEIALRNKESKEVVTTLRDKHIRNLGILKNINLADYGKTEWVRYAPDYRDEELIPIRKITRDSIPREIFSQILEYETKLMAFYSAILNSLVTRKHKELFDSLVTFKDEQIFEIKKFMNSYEFEN